jgi:hypothetical protein
MTRHSATLPVNSHFVGFFGHIIESLGAFARKPYFRPASDTGIDSLEREHSRIRLTSRHWLMS